MCACVCACARTHQVALVFRAKALLLGQPGSCPPLWVDEPPYLGCLLAIYWLCCALRFSFSCHFWPYGHFTKESMRPQAKGRVGRAPVIHPSGLRLDLPWGMLPPPPALPRLMPEVLLLSFTSIHGSGVASLCLERACSRRFVSPQLTDTPWLTF